MKKARSSVARPAVRCAVYTRKSTEEGLDQDFNSLDAQRDSAEAYIKSQAAEGWQCLPDRFDDGGFSGGNMDRPAVQRLMERIEAGEIDCVVVYKVDRLSRSLLDFARMMETFERHGIAFVSVTQQFNTASSMGRLILNVLLSFAQFEREMISERTRDKIAAARRKGKWSGGMPILGYDVVDRKLVVNNGEADQVRKIFALYLERRSLLAVVEGLDTSGVTTKRWTTRKGGERGERKLNKNTLHQLLTNVTYAGKVRHKREVYEGEHAAIVDQTLFDQVQNALHANSGGRGSTSQGMHQPLLRGLLRCRSCECAMIPSYSSRGTRRYRYYLCTNAQKRGWAACPSPSVPAAEVERFVVDEIVALSRQYAEPANSGSSDALAAFSGLWDLAAPHQRVAVLQRVIKQIDYDGQNGSLEMEFRADPDAITPNDSWECQEDAK